MSNGVGRGRPPSRAGRGPGQGGSPWTRPPAQAARYRLPARLSDMWHGWRDGRKKLPTVPVADKDSGGGADADVLPPPRLETARMHVHLRQAMERIEDERKLYLEERATLLPDYRAYRTTQISVAARLEEATARLERARRELSNDEQSRRRTAEQDETLRSEALVRGRRQAEWQRTLAAAERVYQAAEAEHVKATQQVMLQEDLIRARLAVARAVARRHHELAQRRIATYLQHLLRTHKGGKELNGRLGHPVGPELPKWVTAIDDDTYVWDEEEDA